jgi:hypothetical protein
VHEYDRGGEERDQRLEMADFSNCVHDWHRLAFIVNCFSGRARARFLKMNSTTQTLLALLVVGLTMVWFVVRFLKNRKNPGCGGGCACPSTDLKAQLKR